MARGNQSEETNWAPSLLRLTQPVVCFCSSQVDTLPGKRVKDERRDTTSVSLAINEQTVMQELGEDIDGEEEEESRLSPRKEETGFGECTYHKI